MQANSVPLTRAKDATSFNSHPIIVRQKRGKQIRFNELGRVALTVRKAKDRAPHVPVLHVGSFSTQAAMCLHDGIDWRQSGFSLFVEQITTPDPRTGVIYQSALHRIRMHILKLRSFLHRAVYIEVVEPGLPKSWEGGWRRLWG